MGPIQDHHLDQIANKINEFIGNANLKVTHDTRVWVKLKSDNSGEIDVVIGIKPQGDGYVKVPNRFVSKCLKNSIEFEKQIPSNEPSSLSGRIDRMQSFRTKIKPNFFSRLVKSKTPEKDLAKNLIKEDVIAKLKQQGIDDPSSKQVKDYVNLRIKHDDDIKYLNDGNTHSISSYVYFLKQTSKTILTPEEIEKYEGPHTVTDSIHDLVAEADRKNIFINYTTYGQQSRFLPTEAKKPRDSEVKRELELLGINFNPTETKPEDLFRSICRKKLKAQYPAKYSNEEANEIAKKLHDIRFSAQDEIKALNNQLNQRENVQNFAIILKAVFKEENEEILNEFFGEGIAGYSIYQFIEKAQKEKILPNFLNSVSDENQLKEFLDLLGVESNFQKSITLVNMTSYNIYNFKNQT